MPTSYKLPIIIIASCLLLTGIILLIIDLTKSKNISKGQSISPNYNPSNNLPSNDLDETGCFYKNPIKCASDDTTDIRCIAYQMQNAKQIGKGGLCAEISNIEKSNPCYSQYQSVYSGNCGGLDPIVHGNTDMTCANLLANYDCKTIDQILSSPLPQTNDPNYTNYIKVQDCYNQAVTNYKKSSRNRDGSYPENIVQSCTQSCEEGDFQGIKPCGGNMSPGNACYDACKGH